MALPFLERRGEIIRLRLHIQPGARRNQIVGLHGDALKLKIKAPPEDGRANAELLRFLQEVLNVPHRDLVLVAGQASRRKTVELVGGNWEQIVENFRRALEEIKSVP